MRGMIGAGFLQQPSIRSHPIIFCYHTGGCGCHRAPYDVSGLLIQSIRDDDPVVFCEHKMLYDLRARYRTRFLPALGVANYTREGEDVTIIALSQWHKANQVADKLAREGSRWRWSIHVQSRLWTKKVF